MDDYTTVEFSPLGSKKLPVYEKTFFPKKPNDQYVREWFFSKKQSKEVKAPCRGDIIERSAEITNYLAKRQLDAITKKLRSKRIASEAERKSVKEQWKDMVQREQSLRQNFIRFNTFVKENQEKKERAANKIIAEKQLKEDREKKKTELIQKCEEIAKIKLDMDRHIAKYRVYEHFLLQVIEDEPTMATINDLLKRYEALLDARNELNIIQTRNLKKLETAKSNLKKSTDNFTNKVGTMCNKISELEKKHDKAGVEAKKWERIQLYTSVVATKEVINLVSIKESIEKMYLEVCDRKKMNPNDLGNVENQLFEIKKAIGEFEIINRQVLELDEKNRKASLEPRCSDLTDI